jgi:CheY-like chemotaxis protein
MIDVLLIDDEDGILEVIQPYLESDGDIFVKTAESAVEAFRNMGLWDFDLIISDHAMSGGSGLELLKALRRRGNSIPFIFFTAKDKDDLEAEALACGACYFVEKGANLKVKLPELKKTVREISRHNRVLVPGQPREEHIRSLLDTYAHEDPDLEAQFEVFEDPVPNWMKGRQPMEADDAGDAYEPVPFMTTSMVPNLPARRMRRGPVAFPEEGRDPLQRKNRRPPSKMRLARRTDLLREDVGLREAEDEFPLEIEPRHDRWNPQP